MRALKASGYAQSFLMGVRFSDNVVNVTIKVKPYPLQYFSTKQQLHQTMAYGHFAFELGSSVVL